MTGYTAPLRDLQFVLEELVGLEAVATLPGLEEAGAETVRAVLAEAGRFAAEVLAPLNHSGDREGCRVENGLVTTPAGFREAYAAYVAGGWNALPFDPAIGGHGLPWLVATAAAEIWNGANVAFALCPALTQAGIEALEAHGTDAQKQTWLPRLVSGQWTGAMVMTESEAGSDLGAIATRAVRHGEHYRLTGRKIFISWGEHDLTDNIVHMVLARIRGAPAGHRGLSLFLVPKFLIGPDGEAGERNDMRCVALEGKLGLHASPTALMAYGDNDGAIGYLVGAEHGGLKCMFTMMNNARLAIGHQGLGIAERAYQQARDYARERAQGRAVGADGADDSDDSEGDGPDPIIRHPDVRRMLMSMRCRIEAMRALCCWTALSVDVARRHRDAGIRAQHAARVGLLTPLVKSWCTDQAVTVASLGIQIHGGAGYIEETGAAQYLRDARITPIYEGTNGIQAMDLVRRKLGDDDGLTANAMIEEMRQFDGVLASVEDAALAPLRATMADAGAALARATGWMLHVAGTESVAAAAGAVPYQELFATVLGGYLMTRSALIAADHIAEGDDEGGFYAAKIVTARFYAEVVLGGATALERCATQAAEATLALDENQF